MAVIDLRRGDALVLRATFTQNGIDYSMSGWTIEASMKFSNCQAVDLTAAWVDGFTNVGRIRLEEENTSQLQLGDYELNVRVTSPEGDPISTTPVTIRVRD